MEPETVPVEIVELEEPARDRLLKLLVGTAAGFIAKYLAEKAVERYLEYRATRS